MRAIPSLLSALQGVAAGQRLAVVIDATGVTGRRCYHRTAHGRAFLGASMVAERPQTISPPAPRLQVELFGVPRLLAGQRVVTAAGATLAELAADLPRQCPALAGRVLDGASGWPLQGYSFVVDERFTHDRSLPLRAGSSVLLVASAAGG